MEDLEVETKLTGFKGSLNVSVHAIIKMDVGILAIRRQFDSKHIKRIFNRNEFTFEYFSG